MIDLNSMFPKDSIHSLIEAFPMRSWGSIQAKARQLGLRRPAPIPLTSTLVSEGDIGFCAGMIIADGSVMEGCVSSGRKRSKSEGGSVRPLRYYSMPQVKISMEDKESLERVARVWGRKVSFCQKSSTGNDVWSVQIGGKKAMELLRLVLPYFGGVKKKKALYLLTKYGERTSQSVRTKEDFRPFGGVF